MTTAVLEKLNTEEAAEYLGVSRATLETWRSIGKPSGFEGPEFVKSGRRVYYLVSDLNRWVNSRKARISSAIQ